MSPLEAAEQPPVSPPTVPKPARWIGYLRATGYMLIALSVLNLALFRRDGLDAILAIMMVLAVTCLFMARRGMRSQLLIGLAVVATLPFWAAGIYLLHQMRLGTYALFAAPPPPPGMEWVEPAPEHIQAFDRLVERYGKKRMATELESPEWQPLDTVAQAWIDMTEDLDAKTPEEAFADPEFLPALEAISPLLDEFLAARAAAPYAIGRKLVMDLGLPSPLLTRKAIQASAARVIYLHRQGELREAQDLCLLMLMGSANGLEAPNALVTTMIEVAVLLLTVEILPSFVPDIHAGREDEFREALQACQSKLPQALRGSLRGEVEFYRRVLAYPNKRLWEPSEPKWAPNMYLGAFQDIGHRFRIQIHGRGVYWPLQVYWDTHGAHAGLLDRVAQLQESPLADSWGEADEQIEQYIRDSKAWLPVRPNPVGRYLVHDNMPNFMRAATRTRLVQSVLAGALITLDWRELPPGAPLPELPNDPSSGGPYVAMVTIQENAAGELVERLVLSGGYSEEAHNVLDARPLITEVGAAGASFALISERPALEGAIASSAAAANPTPEPAPEPAVEPANATTTSLQEGEELPPAPRVTLPGEEIIEVAPVAR